MSLFGADVNISMARLQLRERIVAAFHEWAHAPEHVSTRGVRVEVPCGEVDPFLWLCAQSAPERLLWSCRESQDVTAGVGCAHLLTGGHAGHAGELLARGHRILESFSGAAPRWYGGFAFAENAVDEAPWPRFGSARFWMPRFEVRQSGGQHVLACNLMFQRHVQSDPAAILAELDQLRDPWTAVQDLPSIVERRDFPDQPGWEANVRAALDLIASGILDKVVLARKAEYRFKAPVPAIEILTFLREVTGTCYHFLLQPDADAAFMGTTPECLYRRKGRDLHTEALAGTRPRDADPETDRNLGEALLQSPKERHEQELVRLALLRQLHLLSERVDADEVPELLQLERKQHLISRIRAHLRDGVGDADLLAALHPTPAVGGAPRGNALKEIPRLEPFSRGWYAAPVGWFGREGAEFAVAIRSGLVVGDRVRIYSGAGIVAGSDPAAEWAEIENKISDFVKVTQRARTWKREDGRD